MAALELARAFAGLVIGGILTVAAIVFFGPRPRH